MMSASTQDILLIKKGKISSFKYEETIHMLTNQWEQGQCTPKNL
jgi:hypothetical protein